MLTLTVGTEDIDLTTPSVPQTPTIEQDQEADSFDRARLADILFANGEHEAAWRLLHCRESGMGWVGLCPVHGDVVYHPQSCELRVCPVCAGARAARLHDVLAPAVAAALAAAPVGYRLRHITLTTTVSLLDYLRFEPSDLSIQIEDLLPLREKIRSYRIGIRQMCQEAFPGDTHLGGGIGAEFGPKGLLLHFHAVILSRYWDIDDLQARWRTLAGADAGYVFVRAAVDGDEDLRRVAGYAIKEIVKAIGTEEHRDPGSDNQIRVARWVTRFGVEPVLAGIHFSLKGVRRFQTFGTFYKIRETEDTKPEVCPECGEALTWLSELEFMRGLANGSLYLKDANNFSPLTGPRSPPDWEQLALDGIEAVIYS